ncbi:UDP-glycosyltransferase 75C1 [Abeliophyllum distichum]|uniref:anthocyanidin 3-O-glucoside 5-O-glucosyltransferase n=1 Tax=Abeliophyllum distichum TaxID=126358 RepID=A0ABD1QUX7_9LAMI
MDQKQVTPMNYHHFLIIFFPIQGHINPSLQLAKNLDDDESQFQKDFSRYMADLRRIGSQSLTNLVQKFLADQEPSATVWAIYHRFFKSQDGIHGDIFSLLPIELLGLPLFSSSDIPSFLLPDNPVSGFILPVMQEHIQVLEEDPRSFVLVNTFEELEQESIKAIANFNAISVGPLIPSAFCDGSDLTDKSFGGDLFSKSEDYIQWLDSKPKSSVIYVSFGSLAVLKKEQKEEILHALVESGRPFLWVLRSSNSEEEEEQVHKMIENGVKGDGIIVPWFSQVEVPSHQSIGCFVTHCGWNSTLESLVSEVPVVGCPQFSDQTTNAKMVEEVWGIGVRAKANGENIIERGEIKKCLDIVMGDEDRGKRMRENASKWRDLAIEAVKEGELSSPKGYRDDIVVPNDRPNKPVLIPIDKVLDASLPTDGRSPIVFLTVLLSNLFIPKKPCERTMRNKQKLEEEKKKNDVRNNSLHMASEE